MIVLGTEVVSNAGSNLSKAFGSLCHCLQFLEISKSSSDRTSITISQ